MLSERDRAAAEAYARTKEEGGLAYDAWLAALQAYGEDSEIARQRVNEVLSRSN